MQVKLKNNVISKTIELLIKLKLKGKQSRHRSRLVQLLNEHIKQVAKEEMELIKEHSNLDKNDEPIIITKENGEQHYDVKDVQALAKDKDELLNEEFIVDGANNKDMINTVKTVLEECNESFSGTDATLYLYLCDAFGIDDNE